MIEFKRGNLFLSECEALGHGNNCEGRAGAGIILQFKQRYPAAVSKYVMACMAGNFHPGDVLPVKCKDKIIVNMATQNKIRRGGNGGARAEWIRKCLEDVRDNHQKYGFASIAFPKVGCNLGGLNWHDIRELFIEIFEDCDLKVEVYE